MRSRLFFAVFVAWLVFAATVSAQIVSAPLLGGGVPGKALSFITSQFVPGSCGATCTFTNGGGGFTIPTGADVHVHVALTTSTASSSLSSITICGQSGTINASQVDNSSADNLATVSTASVTGGSCPSIVAVVSFLFTAPTLGVWYSRSLASSVAASTGTANNCTTCSASVTPSTGGFIIAAAEDADNTTTSVTWTHCTQRYINNTSVFGAGCDNTSAAGATSVQGVFVSGTTARDILAVAAF
jgi:hypothetical protein